MQLVCVCCMSVHEGICVHVNELGSYTVILLLWQVGWVHLQNSDIAHHPPHVTIDVTHTAKIQSPRTYNALFAGSQWNPQPQQRLRKVKWWLRTGSSRPNSAHQSKSLKRCQSTAWVWCAQQRTGTYPSASITHVHFHTSHLHTQTCTQTRMHAHIHTHTHTQTHTHTHTHCTNNGISVFIQVRTYMGIRTYTHAHVESI